MVGRQIRIRRLFHADQSNVVIVPLDHCFSMGALDGMDDLGGIVALVRDNQAHSVILHKGSVQRLVDRHGEGLFDGLLLTVHLSGATSLSARSTQQTLLCGVDEALHLGADWVSVQVNFGCDEEPSMVAMLASLAHQAHQQGIPLLVMAYVRDNNGQVSLNPDHVLHAARASQELGADAVKIPLVPGSVIERARRMLSIPVLVAGGAKTDEAQFLADAERCVRAGARGFCVGRNVFQAADPGRLLRRLIALPHSGPLDASDVSGSKPCAGSSSVATFGL